MMHEPYRTGARHEALASSRFEIIPLRGVEGQLDLLPPGATVTVTSSPRLGVERTIDYTARLAARGFDVVPHLAARTLADRAQLTEIAGRLRAAGVRDVFVIGGDGDQFAGSYRSAVEVVADLAELDYGFERIGVASYPEGHPAIDDDMLLDTLRAKQKVAHYMVTQMCFDPTQIIAWLRRVRQAGIHLPVYVGIPGAVRRARLLRLSFKLGVGQSIRYLTKQHGLIGGVARRGAYDPGALVTGVAAASGDTDSAVEGFHIFTFNEIARTIDWQRRAATGGGG